MLRQVWSVEVECACILLRGATGVSLTQLVFFLLRQLIVLAPFAADLLALLGRKVLNLPVALADLRALLRSEACPLFHLGLQPGLLLRCHLRIVLGDLDPLDAPGTFDVCPVVGERGQDLLLLRGEL